MGARRQPALERFLFAGPALRPLETNELFSDHLEIPAKNLIGEEGQGFKYILTGLNAEWT